MTANERLMAAARALIGTAEEPGPRSNNRILAWILRTIPWLAGERVNDGEWAWCGVFIDNLARDLGLPRPPQAYRARNWLQVGATIQPNKAIPGDVVVMTRPGGFHVTLFAGWSLGGGKFYALGGNQGDRVCISAYPTSAIVGVRRLG